MLNIQIHYFHFGPISPKNIDTSILKKETKVWEVSHLPR